ncbi:MAG: hypothetical protein NZ551_07595 [Microscillaceae bacterium]|nr:hypothetical protein [Microscillaceae bacterium]MDW8461059.1 hypothetical protein [Cytophagales bacterium]
MRLVSRHKIRYFQLKLKEFWQGKHHFPAGTLWGRTSRCVYNLKKSSFLNLVCFLITIGVSLLVWVDWLTVEYPKAYFYGSIALWVMSLVYFLLYRRQASLLYEKFLAEVEQRLVQGKNVKMDIQRNNLIRYLLFFSQLRLVSIQLVLLMLTFLGIYAYNTTRIEFVKKPDSITQVLYEKIRKSELSAQNIEHKLRKNYQTLLQTERLLKMHQKRLQEIQQSIYSHYNSIKEANTYRTKNQQLAQQIKGRTPQEVEEILKKDEFIMTQLKGLVEMKLDLEDKPIEQAAAILGAEGNLIKEFHDLNYRYEQALSLGNYSIYKDYQAIQTTQKLIEKDKQTIENIKKAMQQDSISWYKMKREYQNSKYLLKCVLRKQEIERQNHQQKPKS